MAKKPKTKQKQQGAKGAKSKAEGQKKSTDRLTRGQKIVVVVFIVIFALSTLAGALAAIAPSSSSNTSEETQEDTTSVASVDEQYEGFVSNLEARLAESPEDKATLLSLGKYCSAWASGVKSAATTDEETAHANELFDKAVGYYDQYLALEDSNAVRVSRALCLYDKGDLDGARAALEELTAAAADYAPAWKTLGMVYEDLGDTEAAISAYEKASEADPNDEYGAKTYADQRISALQSSTDEGEEGTDATEAGTDETGATSDDASADTTDASADGAASTDGSGSADLSEDLSDASGTGF